MCLTFCFEFLATLWSQLSSGHPISKSAVVSNATCWQEIIIIITTINILIIILNDFTMIIERIKEEEPQTLLKFPETVIL